MPSPKLDLNFKEFLQLLNTHDVKYLLIGGYAVAIHGYVRATNDIDIWVLVSKTNEEKLRHVFKEFGYEDAANTFTLSFGQMYRMGLPPYRIEVCTDISGVSFEECYPHCVKVTVEDLEIPVIDLANLRKNKAASGRDKDLLDLKNLPNL
jgi:hypothetical protein